MPIKHIGFPCLKDVGLCGVQEDPRSLELSRINSLCGRSLRIQRKTPHNHGLRIISKPAENCQHRTHFEPSGNGGLHPQRRRIWPVHHPLDLPRAQSEPGLGAAGTDQSPYTYPGVVVP
jgi:hypothetical protein